MKYQMEKNYDKIHGMHFSIIVYHLGECLLRNPVFEYHLLSHKLTFYPLNEFDLENFFDWIVHDCRHEDKDIILEKTIENLL